MSDIFIVDVPAGALAVSDPCFTGTTTIQAVDAQGRNLATYYAPTERYRTEGGELVNVAVFPTLPPGNYVVSRPGYKGYQEKNITVFPGAVANVAYE